VLRLALLTVGGVFMLLRALEAHRAARGLAGSEAALQGRVALVWALVGVLALLTAASAALSLRARAPRKMLRLGDVERPGPAGERRQ
jgi:hypothetical protein